jgi:hypothetical protein
LSISSVAQGLDEAAALTVGDERYIIDRWNAMQKELGNDASSSVDQNIHHHSFKFKNTSHMSLHDVKKLLEKKGMKKSRSILKVCIITRKLIIESSTSCTSTLLGQLWLLKSM